MKYMCEICGKEFDDIECATKHEQGHTNVVRCAVVYLCRDGNKWEFFVNQEMCSYEEESAMLGGSVELNVITHAEGRDEEHFCVTVLNFASDIERAKLALLKYARDWYKKRAVLCKRIAARLDKMAAKQRRSK